MLSALLGSETRVKIFKFFFSDPDKLFSVEDIVKAGLGKPLSLQKELKSLVADSFLKLYEEKSEDIKKTPLKKNLKLIKYQANSEHIFFPEIVSIISKEKILSIKDVFSQMKKDFNPKLMFLSGKFVSDDNSPTDIFVVGQLPRKEFLAAIAKLEKKLGYEINFTIMNEQEFEYRRELADVFLFNVLEGKKIIISGDLL